jgi:hypothetical protein
LVKRLGCGVEDGGPKLVVGRAGAPPGLLPFAALILETVDVSEVVLMIYPRRIRGADHVVLVNAHRILADKINGTYFLLAN